MTNVDFLYDPVTAIDEKKATGQTAIIFSDIRSTMKIPMVTSIWRGLANMNNSLFSVWNLAKPIYESGLAEKSLNNMINSLELPMPEALVSQQLSCINLTKNDFKNIQNIIKAYNRSNGMNLMALSALLLYGPIPKKKLPITNTNFTYKDKLPVLMDKNNIEPKVWDIIKYVNSLGSSSGLNSHVATLWRHLSHWPSFLSLVYTAFAPLQSNGQINFSLNSTLSYVKENGINLEKNSVKDFHINEKSLKTLEGYVHTPHQVIRMVVIGNAIEKWLYNYNY